MSIENLPPPGPNNDMKAGKGNDGLFVPLQQLQGLARMYMQFRPIIGIGARMARQKIPKDLDDAMTALAYGDNPQGLEHLREMQGQDPNQGQWQRPGTYQQEVPDNEPGTPVMTNELAEEAYYLHTAKHWGVRQIAQELTDRGNPVSKATVARYIRNIEEEVEENLGQRWHSVASAGLKILAWLGSALGFNLLLRFLHII